jgi:hypothetical protein
MDDRLNRFRQLEGPRSQASDGPERTSTTGRFDAVLGPGEKAPAGPPPGAAPLLAEEAGERRPAQSPATPTRQEAPPISPETLAAMKGNQAELEERLLRELDRRPMHAGQQISLWRALMRRSVEQIEERPAWQGNLAIGLAVALAAFVVGSLLVSGPKLWHLLAAVGIGILLVRHRV